MIEGYVDTDFLEPEGPFGESHGYVALEDFNLAIKVTAITRRKKADHYLDHFAGDAKRIQRHQASWPTSRCS